MHSPFSAGLALHELLADPPWLRKPSLPDVLEGAERVTADLSTHDVPTHWGALERERRLGRARHVRADQEIPLDVLVAREEGRAAKALVAAASDLGLRTTAFRLLTHVGTPLAAPVLVDAFYRLQSLRPLAKRALARFSGVMLEALVPLAIGVRAEALGLTAVQKPAELVRGARLALHYLSGLGELERITQVADRLGVRPAWLAVRREDPLTGAKASPLPEALEAVPRPSWRGGEMLSPETWKRFLTWLSLLDWETPRLSSVESDVERDSLERSMTALFEKWIEEGARLATKWIPSAALELGGAQTAAIVRRTLGEWRAHYQTPSIDVLRAAGVVAARRFDDDVSARALGLLGAVAIKGSSRSQENHARAVIQAVDEVDDLEDRLVPTIGLDPRGKLTVDFGSRKFTIALDATLTLHVSDESGATLPKLPEPKKTDDAAMAKEAKARVKELGRDARILVERLTKRMTSALVTGKRWEVPAFWALLAGHPVVGRFVRGLVWMAYDERDAAIASFRLSEDDSTSDVNDRAIALAQQHGVRLLHPAMVDEETSHAWGRVLADYEIIQPLPQLAWPAFRLTKEELAGTRLDRLRGRRVSSGVLGERGWLVGPRNARSESSTYEKEVGGVRVLLDYPTMIVGHRSDLHLESMRAQKLETIDDACLPWSHVSAVVTSEALNDLDAASY
jgi:hypothetical protein